MKQNVKEGGQLINGHRGFGLKYLSLWFWKTFTWNDSIRWSLQIFRFDPTVNIPEYDSIAFDVNINNFDQINRVLISSRNSTKLTPYSDICININEESDIKITVYRTLRRTDECWNLIRITR